MADDIVKEVEKEIESGGSKTKTILGKAISPSLFLSLGISVVNTYTQFQDMVKIQESQKAQIQQLEQALKANNESSKALVDATRDRFKENERVAWESRSAIIALQTEMEIRSVSNTTRRVPRVQLNDARLNSQASTQRLQDVQPPAPESEPLEGISF